MLSDMSDDEPDRPARERILDAATELFYAQGIRAVGVDTIIARSAVAKASFYRHFPSKDDLAVVYLERRDLLWRQWFVDAVARLSPGPKGRPLAIFDALSERFRSKDFRGCAFINSIVELANRDHAAHIAADLHKREVTALVALFLGEAGFTDEDLPRTFVMLMDGAIVTALREGTHGAAARAKAVASALLAAHRPSASRAAKRSAGRR